MTLHPLSSLLFAEVHLLQAHALYTRLTNVLANYLFCSAR
jgi:hypothetical protein